MTKVKVLGFGLLLFGFTLLNAQPKMNAIEEVFLHINQHELISGETLYFSAFVTSSQTGRLSPMSTLLYVELLDENSKAVYQTKIKLVDGRGYGDLFVSSLFSTGTYQLVAYTRWMKNFNDYFRQSITIINPFESFDPPTLTKKINFQLFPEGGQLVADLENEVTIKLTDEWGDAITTTGRLVDGEGQALVSFSTDAFGIVKTSYTPKSGKDYQAIFDIGQGFEFFDLPRACTTCYQLKATEKRDHMAVSVLGNSDEKVSMVIQSKTQVVFDREVESGYSMNLYKDQLPSGVCTIMLSDQQGKILNQQLISFDVWANQPKSVVDTIPVRSRVEMHFDLDEPATVSVSVTRSDAIPPLGMKNQGLIASTQQILSPGAGQNTPNIPFQNLLSISEWRWANRLFTDSVIYLPEVRADLIEGYAFDQTNQPLTNVPVTLTIPDPQYQIRVASTDDQGKFILNVHVPNEDEKGYIRVLGITEEVSIRLENEFYDGYPIFPLLPVKIDSVKVRRLVDRSIINQIQNAYFDFHKDSLLKSLAWYSQFDDMKIYLLDDYTRFPTMRDTFIEFIPEVGVKKNLENFDMVIRLVDLPFEEKARNHQLLLFDGVPTTSEQILNYSPFNVKSIGVLNKRMLFGGVILDGLIYVSTFGEDLAGFAASTHSFEHKGVQPKKEYYLSNSSAKEIQLPDYRTQLYWNPVVQINSVSGLDLQFYTSDILGEYTIVIEGITESGKPISLQKSLVVTATDSF